MKGNHIMAVKRKFKLNEDTWLPIFLLSPTVILLAGLAIFPLIYLVYLSCFSWRLGSASSSKVFIGISNYLHILSDGEFWNSAKNTILYTLTVVPIELVLGLALAMIILRIKSSKMNKIIRSCLLLPMMTTPVVAALVWRLLYNNDMGIINYIIRLFGSEGPLWLTDIKLSLISIMIVDIWQWTPFMLLIMMAGLSSMPAEPFEAAEVDGAIWWQRFIHLTIHFLRPSLLVALLMRGMDAMKIFDLVYILTFGGPGNSTEVLSLYTYRQGFIVSNMGYASALSIVLSIIITLLGSGLIKMIASKDGSIGGE